MNFYTGNSTNFGWSYPAGCDGPPECEDDEEQEEENQIESGKLDMEREHLEFDFETNELNSISDFKDESEKKMPWEEVSISRNDVVVSHTKYGAPIRKYVYINEEKGEIVIKVSIESLGKFGFEDIIFNFDDTWTALRFFQELRRCTGLSVDFR